MECIGNCVWVSRISRGGFGCSRGSGGGECALCSLVLVCSSVTNTNMILHYSSLLVKKTL
jgi:hypothetical protein